MLAVEFDIGALQSDLDSLGALLSNAVPRFLTERLSELEVVIQDNNGRVWETGGANIGADWRGNTLVQTGELRDSMRSVEVVRVGDSLLWSSDVPYAQHVDERYNIYGIDEEALSELQEEFSAWLQDKLDQLN